MPIYTFRCRKCGAKRDIICSLHGEFIEKDNVCVCGKTAWEKVPSVPARPRVIDGTPIFHSEMKGERE